MDNKEEKKERVTLTSFDPVETPEEVIRRDKDEDRKEEFKKANAKIAKIIPEYFMSQRKKRKNTSTGDEAAFSQELKVTPENATIAVHATTKENSGKDNAKDKEEKQTEEKERE